MSKGNQSPITQKSDAFRHLANSKIFENLEPEHIIKLVAISHLEQIKENAVILDENWLNAKLYIIVSGTARVTLPDTSNTMSEADNVELAVLGPNDSIGEFSIIDNQATSARVVALENMSTIMINKQDLEAVLAQDDFLAMSLYKNLLHIVLQRSRSSYEDTISFSTQDD